jgi:hypothetical protein
MENQEQPEPVNELENFFNLSFDSIGREHLKQIALWAKICSIISLIGYVVQLYLWLFGNGRAMPGIGSGFIGGLLTVAVVGGGATINYFLYRFAVVVSRGVENTDAYYVNSGLNSLRMYFKTFSIVVIVALCIFFFAILGFVFSDFRNLQ